MTFSDSNIIFLISLPRSGSTLLQRLLATHSQISTTSESWILLPILYPFTDGEVFAEYDHETCTRAIREFTQASYSDEYNYKKSISDHVVNIFGAIAHNNDQQFFLEKTPRNNLVLDQLLELFPNSKFIFMWRNPVSVASSIVDTFGQGSWKIRNYEVDLYKGLDNMIRASELNKDRILSIRYEDLILNSQSTCETLFRFIGVNIEQESVNNFYKTSLSGTLGDKSGTSSYRAISEEPLAKWRKTVCNPIRKRWMINYINWIGKDRLQAMGYDYVEIKKDLVITPMSYDHISSDMLRTAYSWFDKFFCIGILRKKLSKLARGERFYISR